VLGPECGLEQLQTVAALLLAHGRSRTTQVHLVPGSRQVRESLAAIGLLEPLVAAGVALDDPAAPAWAGHVAAPGVGVVCGVPAATVPYGVWWQAGPWLAAAAAVTGRLGDPRTLDERSGRAADVPLGFRVTVDDALLTRPAAGGDAPLPPSPDGLAPPAPGTALAGSLRAVVLLEVREGVPVLAWGPRLAALGARISRLAEQVFATADPEFAGRARAHAGVAILCHGAYRSGGPPVVAALALAALGVGAVIAKEFTPADRDALAGQGILPLRPAAPGDLARVHAGDELEVPDLPDGLAPRRALVVRDLTRGHQLLLRHDLDASVVATVRAGGRLAEASAGLAPAPVGA
jgi:aconitate hydratase